MTATLFQASQEGNVDLVSSLLEEPSLDIDARDETGLTALHYAVRGNHVDVVTQLLAKGANAVEVAQDDALKHNQELASVINNALQHTQSAAFQSAPVIDSHGGKQLPDGTVSYVQPPAFQGQVDASMHQQHPLHHPMSQPIYPFQPQHAFFDPSHNPEHRGHAHKDSASGSLPPPEVAKMIPCRFFPNCRYGDKCMFAHPVAMPASSPNAGPVSPGQAPMFYQSHAYGYPAYGPPQHFYSMAPPMPIQYTHAGVPMPVHMPPPHHMAHAPHSNDGDAYANHFAAQSRQSFEPNQTMEGESAPAAHDGQQQAAAETEAASVDGDDTTNAVPTAEATVTDDERAKSSPEASTSNNAPTSFSAFMAHHAAPFQPAPGAQNGVVGMDGGILSSSQTFNRGNKGARRGGASMGGSFGSRAEFGKRSTERPACHFFARSACKHGEDCRFPHILPDGTDMRGPNAGRSSNSIEAARAINRALAAKSARAPTAGSMTNGASAAHSSTPVNKEANGLPAAPTNVTVSTSPASAQTTISAADKNEADKPASTDKDAEQKPAANVNLPSASPKTSSATQQEQSNAGKATSTGAASTQVPKATSSNGTAANKSDSKVDSATNGKRAAAPVAAGKSDESKPAAGASANGDRIPASIPSKPTVNGNASGHVAVNRQNGAKSQPNGVQGGKGNQNQQNGARPPRANQNNNGRSNGQAGQNGAGQKKPVTQQRLPSAADFPALSNGQAAAASSTPSANGTARPNFSAILSAPAPVKKQPEPVKESEAPAADDKTIGAAASSDEAKEGSTSTLEAEAKTTGAAAAPKQTSSAAPMLDFAAVVQSNPVAV
ncbi:hypothetical protein PHBOTO_000063 [Pseudozyma hubeiensis]|nr:hypothetical protein PHBOTO_000063 [Pseudozyma hubeiensis]